mmetsp:Transcript_36779/g.61470  ORF Transcript_36779/g.61470 Transcript_36779/m.61470 type:complete len:430 (+) Transcript_36779:1487-2776(+)
MDLQHPGEEVGGGDEELRVAVVAEVWLHGPRELLVPGPEGLAFGRLRVLRKLVNEVHDLVPEQSVEDLVRHSHARLQRGPRGPHLQRALQHLQFGDRLADGPASLTAGVEPQRVRPLFVQKLLRVLHEDLRLPRGADEEVLELRAAPLDAVVDDVREVPEGAHRDAAALRGLAAVGVRPGLEGDDHVDIGRGAGRPGLQERLPVEHASAIHIKAGLHVVQGIADHVQVQPEVVVKDVLRGARNQILARIDVDGGVDDLGPFPRGLRFGLAHVVFAEQELPVQIGHLDAVVIGHPELAVAAAHPHQREILDELAAKGPTAHHEELQVGEPVLERFAVHSDEVIVSGVQRLSVCGGSRRECLEGVIVQPLLHGGELTAHLDQLLAHNPSEEGTHRLHLNTRMHADPFDDGLVGLDRNRLEGANGPPERLLR